MLQFGIRIAVGSDHAGYLMKEKVKAFLASKGYEPVDFGTNSANSTDYPDYAHAVAYAVERKDFSLGILLCGSGNGVNMTANKHLDIRSALCWTPEIARLARLHNDANILALPARFINDAEMYKIVQIFLSTSFEGGRHCARVEKIRSGLETFKK